MGTSERRRGTGSAVNIFLTSCKASKLPYQRRHSPAQQIPTVTMLSDFQEKVLSSSGRCGQHRHARHLNMCQITTQTQSLHAEAQHRVRTSIQWGREGLQARTPVPCSSVQQGLGQAWGQLSSPFLFTAIPLWAQPECYLGKSGCTAPGVSHQYGP